ncbi:MAG: response regulator, partial [Perlucidibaca sp.]
MNWINNPNNINIDINQNIRRSTEFSNPAQYGPEIPNPGFRRLVIVSGTDGLRMLKILQRKNPNLPVIIMTAHSDLSSAVASYQGGAFEYLPKPFDVDEAVALVKRAVAHHQEQQTTVVPELTETARSTGIIGESPAMQEVFRAIGRLSNSNITVLINGESGTGK